MPERSNGTVLKTVVPERVPWVRIPPSPQLQFMDKFEKKHGIEEDKATRDLYLNRRMFCIINNVLYTA